MPMEADELAPLQLPLFPTPFRLSPLLKDDSQSTGWPMRTLLEVSLDDVKRTIRSNKAQWWRKVHNAQHVCKWRAEFEAQGVPQELHVRYPGALTLTYSYARFCHAMCEHGVLITGRRKCVCEGACRTGVLLVHMPQSVCSDGGAHG